MSLLCLKCRVCVGLALVKCRTLGLVVNILCKIVLRICVHPGGAAGHRRDSVNDGGGVQRGGDLATEVLGRFPVI